MRQGFGKLLDNFFNRFPNTFGIGLRIANDAGASAAKHQFLSLCIHEIQYQRSFGILRYVSIGAGSICPSSVTSVAIGHPAVIPVIGLIYGQFFFGGNMANHMKIGVFGNFGNVARRKIGAKGVAER